MKRGINLPSWPAPGNSAGGPAWSRPAPRAAIRGSAARSARERHRPFGQRGHLVEHVRVDDGLAAFGLGRGEGAGPDALAPRLEVGAHEALLERGQVSARRAQRDRLAGMEAVAARHAAGRDAEDLPVDHLVAVQHDDPVDRPHELRGPRAPAHAPRDRERIERGLHDAGEELRGRLARARRPAEEELALVVVEARELVDLHAAGFGEGGRGACRLAGGVEGGRNRRAAALDALLRLAVEELRHLHREAARREVGERRAVRRARGLESGDDAVAERRRRGRRGSSAAFPPRRSRPGSRGGSLALLHADGVRQGTVPLSCAQRVRPLLSRGKPCASRLAK